MRAWRGQNTPNQIQINGSPSNPRFLFVSVYNFHPKCIQFSPVSNLKLILNVLVNGWRPCHLRQFCSSQTIQYINIAYFHPSVLYNCIHVQHLLYSKRCPCGTRGRFPTTYCCSSPNGHDATTWMFPCKYFIQYLKWCNYLQLGLLVSLMSVENHRCTGFAFAISGLCNCAPNSWHIFYMKATVAVNFPS